MSNLSSQDFDFTLSQIPHFRAYPAMTPYVGESYRSSNHCKLLLVGESYGPPEGSTIHHDVERWYAGTQQQLDSEEVRYLHCRRLLSGAWDWPGHEMYREIERCLQTLCLPGHAKAISHVAFMNTFLRPAKAPGESFKHGCTPTDIDASRETIRLVVEVLEPDLVVFVSKFAWDAVGHHLAEQNPHAKFLFTAHPTAYYYWNRNGYPHGREKLLRILQSDFLTTADLIKDSP